MLADFFDADVRACITGDRDILRAFGSQGIIEFQVILGTGSLCTTTMLTRPAPGAPGTPTVDSFSGPPNGSIASLMPEPFFAILLAAGPSC